jgi:hypothetical protein
VADLSLILPPPHPDSYNISPWLDEQIWGHRLWDSESPWLLFLEFLTVAEACHREGRLLQEDPRRSLDFKPYKRMYLRNILFNNEDIEQIDERHSDSRSAWEEWLRVMSDRAFGIRPLPPDFSFLRTRFHSFHDFAAIVTMIRSSDLESASNRRWTSRFVFPFGPGALYEDLIANPSSGSVSRDYINFGRTGELLYLMLCRSANVSHLKPFVERIVRGQSPWNDLAETLQPNGEDDLNKREGGFLPYQRHESFDKLADDWIHVLKLRLPGYDAYPYLVNLGALHVLLYQLSIALERVKSSRELHLICEIVAPKKSIVRELSASNYLENNLLPARAVSAYIDEIEHSDEWQQIVRTPGALMKCRQLLQEKVRWGESNEDYDGATAEGLMAELRRVASEGHKQHAAKVHRAYGRDVGLVSKRGTNKLRYAPTDGLLKTLLLANVETRVELNEFLQRLYDRYGLIVGDRQAETVLATDDFDKKAFQANARRLEERLSSLGVLRRLSDGCAYVENPYDSVS